MKKSWEWRGYAWSHCAKTCHVFASCLYRYCCPSNARCTGWTCCTEASRNSDVPVGSLWARVNSGTPLPKSLFCQPLQVGLETCAPNRFRHAYVTQRTLCVFAWMYSRHSYAFSCILNDAECLGSTSQLLQLISFFCFTSSWLPDAQTRQATGRWLHTSTSLSVASFKVELQHASQRVL